MSEKAGTGKDVIYIDVDDEITAIIDKVRGSGSKIVALVLPKRATVLQSIVNMKLLKRSAETSKKHLVLITSEAGLLPLAGSVGVHVAKSLQSKPEIPDAPARSQAHGDDDEAEAVDAADADDNPLDASRPVGELAGAAAVEDTIELDDADDDTAGRSASGAPAAKGTGKKFKIPNFNRFRLLILLGGVGVVALIILGYVAFAVMPKATVSIKTDSQSITSSTVVTFKTGQGVALDIASATVPAHAQEIQKTINQQVDATGQQNNGQKAGGTVKIKNCTDDSLTIPAGTGLSASGLTFITQDTVALDEGEFSSPATGGVCKQSGDHVVEVDVVSQGAGTKYNIAAQAYTVAGYGNLVTGSGSAMAGGTDDITKIVLQADIDSAVQKIGAQDTAVIKETLQTDLKNAGYFPLPETFNAGAPDTKTSVKAGDKADTVTVTQTIKYTMLGAKEDDLKKIIAEDVSQKIDADKQSILDYGLDTLVFGIQSQPADGAVLTMQTAVVAGPDLDINDIKKQVAGKKAGDAKELIKEHPGVTDVEVRYSPFWVGSIPGKTSKITVTVEEPKAEPTDDSGNAGSAN